MNENMLRAEELFQKNRLQEALELYDQEIMIAPNNVLAYESAVKCLFNLKHYDKAIDLSNKALSINPGSATLHAMLAEIHYDLNDVEMSWREVKKAYEMDPNSFQVIMTYGTLLLMDHQLENAIPLLERAAQINPNSYILHFNLSQAYLQKNDLKGHYLHNREIFRLRPTFAKGLRFVFSYINLIKPILNATFLLTILLAIVTRSWLILIIPFSYSVVMIIGSILLSLTKK